MVGSPDPAVNGNLPFAIGLLLPNRKVISVAGQSLFRGEILESIRTRRITEVARARHVGVDWPPIQFDRWTRGRDGVFQEGFPGFGRMRLKIDAVFGKEHQERFADSFRDTGGAGSSFGGNQRVPWLIGFPLAEANGS